MKHWRARHFPQTADPKRLRGGQAATVAGYVGPGFHTWPAGHIHQDADPKQPRRRPSRHCSRVRWSRFPHLALRPHPSRHRSESASPQPVHCQKDVRKGVRRRDRGQRPTATKDPNSKQPRRRPSRHCSRVRRPRFPHLALRPHPSSTGYETASPQPVPLPKRRSAPRPGSATHGYRKSEHETTAQAAKPPLEPGTPAPVSTLGLQATSLKTMAPNSLRRIRSPTKKTFRGPRLCGVPSERGFLFPGDSQGLHPGLVCDAPTRAWDSKHGRRAGYRNRGQGMESETLSCHLPQRGKAYQLRASPLEPDPRESVCSEGTPHREGGPRRLESLSGTDEQSFPILRGQRVR
jgi:hypothetical protein